MVLERVFDGGLVDIVHVDVVCDGIRYSEQRATPLGFCALYYVCISLLYTHVAGPGDVVQRDDADEVEGLHIENLDRLVLRDGGDKQSVERRHQRCNGGFMGIEVLYKLNSLFIRCYNEQPRWGTSSKSSHSR